MQSRLGVLWSQAQITNASTHWGIVRDVDACSRLEGVVMNRSPGLCSKRHGQLFAASWECQPVLPGRHCSPPRNQKFIFCPIFKNIGNQRETMGATPTTPGPYNCDVYKLTFSCQPSHLWTRGFLESVRRPLGLNTEAGIVRALAPPRSSPLGLMGLGVYMLQLPRPRLGEPWEPCVLQCSPAFPPG